MIALTVSDMMDADAACMRIAELIRRGRTLGVPDAVCIRNDSFTLDPFRDMIILVKSLWTGDIVLESDDPGIMAEAVIPVMERVPLIVGANSGNLDHFIMIARTFGCRMCVSESDPELLFDLIQRAESEDVKDLAIDPMMRNMKQCLEVCTDIRRLSASLPEAGHPLVVRTWSGEYAMSMATVSMLVTDAIIITDDLDYDCCEVLGELSESVR